MTLIVKTVTHITLGFILLYGVYIALTGHVSPGGGFAGGVIVALALVHVMLAFGKDAALKYLTPAILRILVSAGALSFLCITLLIKPPHRIFNNEITMPLCEMIVVGAGLFAIFIALVLLSKSDKRSE